MATIKDIARLAGVGLGTVSRVINGGKSVSPETYQKVMEAARSLNFRPNQAARSLARGEYSRHTLGVVLPVAVHPFYFEILKGIYSAVSELDYNIMIFNLGEEKEEVYEHILDEALPGLLIVACALPETARKALNDSRTLYYYIDYFDENDPSFFIDNHQGGRIAARHLLDQGCRNILYIGENTQTQQQDERFQGFEEVIQQEGLELVGDMRIPINELDSLEATLQAMQKYSPDGIFYFCDELAYGGLKARRKSGLHPLILGYDDKEASQYLGLSSIAQPAFEMGFSGASEMIASLQKDSRNKIQKSFIPTLIRRDD